MKFKFRGKRKQHRVYFNKVVSPEDFIYKYALDTRLLSPTLIRDILDLVPAPEDVLDEDSAESMARLKAVLPITPIVEEFSKTTAALVLASLTQGDGYHVSDDEVHDMMAVIQVASYTASLATVTQLEELGVIEYRFAR